MSSGDTAGGDTSASAGSGWNQSDEYKTVRRTRLAIAVLLAAIAAVGSGYLLMTRYQAKGASADGGVISQLETEADEARSKTRDARDRLSIAQRAVEDAEKFPSLYGSPTGAKTDAVNDARAEVDSAVAQEQRAADAYNKARRAEAALADRNASTPTLWLILGAALLIAGVISLEFYKYIKDEKRRQFDNRMLVAGSVAKTSEPGEMLDLETLWTYNRDQLQRYHQLVLNYATSARKATQITLSVSFVFLLAVGTLAFFARSVPSAVASSIVVAAGATVTGFVARAVLRNAETSTQEVSAFFTHPLEVEKILAAERIIATMPEAAKEGAQLLMIQALTQSGERPPPADVSQPSSGLLLHLLPPNTLKGGRSEPDAALDGTQVSRSTS